MDSGDAPLQFMQAEDPLRRDPDHDAIMARRNRLIALAVSGLAGLSACGGRTPMEPAGAGGAAVSRSYGTGGTTPQDTGGSSGTKTPIADRGAGGTKGSERANPEVSLIADAGSWDSLTYSDAAVDTTDSCVAYSCGCQGAMCQGCT